jgi:peptidoglycan/xylan/chitin deacetylase (PgdA/CDA1 family)
VREWRRGVPAVAIVLVTVSWALSFWALSAHSIGSSDPAAVTQASGPQAADLSLASGAALSALPPLAPAGDALSGPDLVRSTYEVFQPAYSTVEAQTAIGNIGDSEPALVLAKYLPPSAGVSQVAAESGSSNDSAELEQPSRTSPPVTEVSAPAPTPTPGAEVHPPQKPERSGKAGMLLPILMYHYVSVPPEKADIYRRDLSVTPGHFEEQLRFLRQQGYHTVTLDQMADALREGKPLPSRPIVLTFDDGYDDNYSNAFPLLKQYGMTGTFFIITDFVNNKRAGYMSWEQIAEMHAAGERFESHTRDHPDLRKRSVEYLVWEATGSAEAIESHLRYRPHWICYPSGHYDEKVVEVFASAGYIGGLTTRQGTVHSVEDLFTLTRVRVHGTTTVPELSRAISGPW